MTYRVRNGVGGALLLFLASVATASAECAWVLWSSMSEDFEPAKWSVIEGYSRDSRATPSWRTT